jgi:hypothetical protein
MKKITVTLSDIEAVSLADFRKSGGYESDEDALRGALELASAQTGALATGKEPTGLITISVPAKWKRTTPELPWFPKIKPGSGTLARIDHVFPSGMRLRSCAVDHVAFGKFLNK